MKQSTKIIIFGLLSSIALIVSCVYFKYDMINQSINGTPNSNEMMVNFNNKKSKINALSKSMNFQTEISEKKFEQQKFSQELQTLKVSSLNYKIEKTLITIDGKLPILDEDDVLKKILMSRCKEVRCDKKIHFSSEQVDPKWKGVVIKIIDLFHTENITKANLVVEGNEIYIHGEFKDEKAFFKLDKIIKPYLAIYYIKNETTFQKVIPILSPDDIKVPIAEKAMSQTIKTLVPKPHHIALPQAKKTIIKKKHNSMKVVEEKILEILREKKINFYKNSAKITRKGKRTLNKIIAILRKEKNIRIEVQGHTDASGKAKINQWISSQRAKSVKNYLGSMGLNPATIVAKGFGETRLLLKNRPNSAKNRRVEIKIKRR